MKIDITDRYQTKPCTLSAFQFNDNTLPYLLNIEELEVLNFDDALWYDIGTIDGKKFRIYKGDYVVMAEGKKIVDIIDKSLFNRIFEKVQE